MGDLSKAYAAKGRANRKLIQRKQNQKVVSGLVDTAQDVSAVAHNAWKRNKDAWDEFKSGAEVAGIKDAPEAPTGISMLWKAPPESAIYGGEKYERTAEQNLKLMDHMGLEGNSLVDALKSKGIDSSEENREKLFAQYTGGFSSSDLRKLGKLAKKNQMDMGPQALSKAQEMLDYISKQMDATVSNTGLQ